MATKANSGTTTLLDAVTATGAGSSFEMDRRINEYAKNTYQAFGTTSAGAGSATIVVQVSNDDTNWLTLGTITLTLATTVSNDGFASDAPWPYRRGNVTALSGTDATVTLTMGS